MKIWYQCDVCRYMYEDEDRALACETQQSNALFVAGDVVMLTNFRASKFEGDKDWVAKRDDAFASPSGALYTLYYRVAAVTPSKANPHVWVYHLWTNGRQDYGKCGQVISNRHLPVKVNPQDVPLAVYNQSMFAMGLEFKGIL